MNYLERKAAAHRDLVASVHGEGGETVPGLPPIVLSRVDPTVRRLLQPPPSPEPRELGWGRGIVIEDGASLIFPGLAEDGRR